MPKTFEIIFGLLLIASFPDCRAGIKIQINEKTMVEWFGCLYKKFPIYPWENSTCSDCVTNGLKLAKFDIALSQNYKNCTRHCPRPTICTEYKYSIDDVFRSECYQCEHTKKEVIKFRALRSYKICSEECKQCARDADLSTAIYCSFKCNGNPTFCYPKEMWFGHHKCYQSSKMYGCTYTRIENTTIKTGCLDCALTAADRVDAQQCASECNGIPTYHEIDEFGKNIFFQCQLGIYHEVFEHDIPPEILNFLKVETPLGRSKAIQFLKYVPTYSPNSASG